MRDTLRTIGLASAIAALAAALYLPLLGFTELEREEPRRAVIARTMVATGDYLVPQFEGRPYLKKPPLYNWAIAATGMLRGRVDEVSARLPSVLSLCLLAALVVWWTRDVLGPTGQSFAAVATVLAPVVAEKARLAEIELLFTLLVTASLWVWFHSWRARPGALRAWLPAAVLAGLAFLTKREPALLFFYLGVGAGAVACGQARRLWSSGAAASVVVVAAAAGLWLVPAAVRVGVEPLWRTTVAEVLARGAPTSLWQLVGHLVTFPFEVLGAALPFSLFLLPLADRRVRARLDREYGDAYRFALWAAIANFFPYWLRGDSAVRYFMPMVPTLMVLSAMVFELWAERGMRCLPAAADDLARRARTTAVRIMITAGAAIVVSDFMPQWLYQRPSPVTWQMAGALGVAIAALGPAIARIARTSPRLGLAALVVSLLLVARVTTFTFWLVEKDEHNEHMAEKMARLAAALPQEAGSARAVGPLPGAAWFYAPAGFLTASSSHSGSGDSMTAAETDRAYFVYADGRVDAA
ncbi:MAG: phospholipid carrier-dependent glycosyltransferase, partial [Deltaproteobacteria bacterium]